MRTRSIRAGVLAALVAFQAAAASAIHAQIVRGRLADADGDTAIGGAMMTLMDRDGSAVERTLTNTATGLFELRAPAPGEYRVRAERIGYATTFSAFFEISAGETVTVEVSAPIEALSLEGITAAVGPRCEVRPEEGMAVATVWNEARKALAAAAWTQDRGLYRYEMLGINRLLDARGQRVEVEDRVYRQSLVPAPYIARAADSLVSEGFARLSADASEFWAPDADVLLSDAFLDTHCLRIRSGGRALVGLEFEPVPDRDVPEIAGTLWLNAATAELQRVDFRYVNLPVPQWLMDASPGGAVVFRGLPNGTWIVTSWHIRMFSAGAAENPLTGRLAPTLEGVTMTHGEVLRVHGDEGVVFEGESGRRVAGTVVDSLGVGLPGARVYVEGSGTRTVTDADGRFELDHLSVATYELRFTHPDLEQLRYAPEPVEVALRPEVTSPVEVTLEAPSMSEILDDVCGSDGPPGVPLIGGRWQGRLANGHPDREGDGRRWETGRGRDAAPAGESLRGRALRSSQGSGHLRLRRSAGPLGREDQLIRDSSECAGCPPTCRSSSDDARRERGRRPERAPSRAESCRPVSRSRDHPDDRRRIPAPETGFAGGGVGGPLQFPSAKFIMCTISPSRRTISP